ncbi:hypothetical protein B9J07_12940 [Sinorhizobium sp. LM21]|uniref:queuine tRNA-ribosyltransferase n=1 Tax=Sinorhizobium phage phiLM21 TaxID=1524882 RepID=UPI0004E5C76F|nr:queuine tRNA-ribosyltransferase [Sinorhizobium phage phiLM21]AII27777.1 hypothetical protein phiLM21_p025 [Sinorhizobium phage phiLM21]OWZ93542.1 hypothetical protein B9J07_12940 [Sinorhizobium sp. LM21]
MRSSSVGCVGSGRGNETSVKFYVGLHQPADAQHFELACISINRLRGRKKPVECGDIIVDSGAFTELNLYGEYRHGVEEYAAELYRLYASGVVNIAVAVAQDYMCEPFMLAKTGLTVADHQRLTIARYDALVAELNRLFGGKCPFPIMPVLQGYSPSDYVSHVEQYGDRLKFGMWVGVGSVCKRQGDPRSIIAVLQAIRAVRPDLRLHGFGVKVTSLLHPGVRECLYSSDSMAWSFAARKAGRNANDWREAASFTRIVNEAASAAFQPWQMEMFA